jgi:hypothetical protein
MTEAQDRNEKQINPVAGGFNHDHCQRGRRLHVCQAQNKSDRSAENDTEGT